MNGCRKAFVQRGGDAGLPAGAGRLIRSKGDMAVGGLEGLRCLDFWTGEGRFLGEFLVADVY